MSYTHLEKIQELKRNGQEEGIVTAGHLLEEETAAGRYHPGRIPYIHVAGTNGKGSVCAMLMNVLTAAGLKCGLYTSPHLVDFTERIQIGGKKIPHERADELAARMLDVAARTGISGNMFCYATVMAAEYFEETDCSIAVIETGLGGRYDATNALGTPELCVITPIGMDHMQLLGSTIEEIACAKAGIIKSGVPVVTGRQEAAAMKVLEKECAKKGCTLFKADAESSDFPYRSGLSGLYQKENALTALKALEVLGGRGLYVSEAARAEGFASVKWPGRFQKIGSRPDIILDGAHNSHGVNALHDALNAAYPGQKIHFLMGVLADKDYGDMVDIISDIALRIDTVTPDSLRALDGNTLSELIRARGLQSVCYDSTPAAVKDIQNSDPDIPACIFGSLYFIGEIEKIMN